WLDPIAVIRAIQCMVETRDRVVVFETQDCSRSIAAIGAAADNLYDSGAIVIAAVGNLQKMTAADMVECDNHIGSPASSRRAIAVGAREILTDATPDYQSHDLIAG